MIPIVPPTPKPTNTATTCSDGSDHKNDKICTATKEPETVVQPQDTPTPEPNPIANKDDLDNSLLVTPIQSDSNNNVGNINSGSKSQSNNDITALNEEDKIISNKQDNNDKTGADSRFILIAQDRKIALFQIISDETALDTNVLPKTIRPIETFDNEADALAWLSDYDSR